MSLSTAFHRRHTFVQTLPPLLLGEQEYCAQQYEVNGMGGKSHIVFLRDPVTEPATPNSTRLGIYIDRKEESICFLGMYVNGSLRGNGAGKAIAQYFLDIAKKQELAATHTATIRKPLIALSLARTGFTPCDEGVEVAILPELQSSPTRAPHIAVIKPAEMPDGLIEGSDAGPFYHVIETADIARHYPVNDPLACRAIIHTRFSPPKYS